MGAAGKQFRNKTDRDAVSVACYRSRKGIQIATRIEEAARLSLEETGCYYLDHEKSRVSFGARSLLEVRPFCVFPRAAAGSAELPPGVGEAGFVTTVAAASAGSSVTDESVNYPLGAKALAVADKLLFCNRSENVWHGTDLHSKDGDLFEGCGTLWNCNERLCPSCLANRARMARSVVRAAVKRVRPMSGQRWRFVTLTMPTRPADESSLLVTLQVVTRAWRLFSKREWWRDIAIGGVKGVEFTLGNDRKLQEEGREWSPEIDGYHVHLHLLVLSKWVEWRRMRQEWSACLKTAWREFGIAEGINTRDGLAVCDVRLVVSGKRHGRGMISDDSAVLEVAKYITKSESWDKVPASQLVEVASMDRWPRMFELLGACRAPSKPKVSRELEAADTPSAPGVTMEDRLYELQNGNESEHRLCMEARAQLFILGEIDPLTLMRVLEITAYLDTPNLSGGGEARAGPLIMPKKRSTSLRQVGAALIASGCRKLWRETLACFVEERRSFRRCFQVRTFPFATFHDLVGKSWGGIQVNTAR